MYPELLHFISDLLPPLEVDELIKKHPSHFSSFTPRLTPQAYANFFFFKTGWPSETEAFISARVAYGSRRESFVDMDYEKEKVGEFLNQFSQSPALSPILAHCITKIHLQLSRIDRDFINTLRSIVVRPNSTKLIISNCTMSNDDEEYLFDCIDPHSYEIYGAEPREPRFEVFIPNPK